MSLRYSTDEQRTHRLARTVLGVDVHVRTPALSRRWANLGVCVGTAGAPAQTGRGLQAMVTTSAVLGIALVALGLVLTPGPNMIYLVSRSITQGRQAGLISLLGVAVGFLVYLAAASAGLATVFVAVPAAYTALKLAGAAYLLYLAWQAVRPGGTNAFAPKPLPVDGPRRLFAMGLVTNLLNPKIAVLYVSLLPQFIDPERGSVALQSLVLGLTQIMIALSVNALIVVFAGALAAFLAARPTWLRVQRYLMGGVLGALAVRLATERTRPATT